MIKVITLTISFLAFGYAIYSVRYFLNGDWGNLSEFKQDAKGKIILFTWIFGPPTWFFFERFVLHSGATDDVITNLREGRDLAKPIWAAVLATLLLLLK